MTGNSAKMYVEDNDIIELMLANRQAKILPRNLESYKNFEIQCKNYGIHSPFILDSDDDSIEWLMPDEYKNLDIRQHILTAHKLSVQEIQRIDLELIEFEKRNLIDLLRFLCYFVAVIKNNNIVYGVGRGSSVASYVLYLIGVHRINSFEFNLDIKEFLK